MPTILSITSESKQGIFSSLFCRKRIITTDYQTKGKTIRLISYCQRGGKIPWGAICSQIAPIDQKRLLCPVSLRVPQETGLKCFVPSYYGPLMAQNTFFSVLNQADIPPRRLQLMLYDPCGYYQETAKRMMSHCSQLWIYTENPINYRKAIQEMREELGGEPLLTDRMENIWGCQAILCPGRWMTPYMRQDHPMLFSGYPPLASFHGLFFWRYHMNMPEEYRHICPFSLENFYFLAALYELCGIHDLARLIPTSCVCGEEDYPLERLAEILQKSAK